MTRKELERRYEEHGLMDYQLKSLDDMKVIHNINVMELSGYSELPDNYRKLFDKTILSYFNAHGLDNRKELVPKSVNYVQETEYIKDIDEHSELVGILIQSIDKDGKKHRLHRYVLEKSIPFSECRKYVTNYLRFELKGEWFHITEKGEWY